jgi:integrase/recombinase XerD
MSGERRMSSRSRPDGVLNPTGSRSEGVQIMPDERSDSGLILPRIQHSSDGGSAISRHAHNDEQLIELWLHGRSRHTQRAYRFEAERFRRHVPKPLIAVTLGDLHEFVDALGLLALAPGSRNRVLVAVKSLYSFGHKLGYLPFDVARAVRLAPARDGLSERILSEPEVQRMIALEPNPRNRTLLTTLYASGVRVSEVSGLRWRDVQGRAEGGQITVFGKGGKTRSILLPQSVWTAVMALRGERGENDPVFRSRKRSALSPSQILRVVKRAAKRAGLSANVVVHTFRHCHASHSLERGAPIHLVQATLGHSSVATTGRYLHARPSDSSSRYLPV